MMLGTMKLDFMERPFKEEIYITPGGGEWGAPRGYGSHMGVDYKAAWRSHVRAVEDGVAVYSGLRAGTASRTNYGNTVAIDHTPEAGDTQRHIYSLYAHLHQCLAHVGKRVKKGEIIGESGNTGTVENPRGLAKKKAVTSQKGHHLHFEIIDTVNPSRSLGFADGWPEDLRIGDRKDPTRYLAQKRTIEYDPTPEQMSIIRDSVDPRPVVDFERGVCRVDWYVGGIYKGATDANNKEIDLKLTSKEVEEILRRTPVASGNEQQIYELKI